jgi:hypothetical protein
VIPPCDLPALFHLADRIHTAHWVLGGITQALFVLAFSGGGSPDTRFLLPAAMVWALQVVPMPACLLTFPAAPMSRAQRIRLGLDMVGYGTTSEAGTGRRR